MMHHRKNKRIPSKRKKKVKSAMNSKFQSKYNLQAPSMAVIYNLSESVQAKGAIELTDGLLKDVVNCNALMWGVGSTLHKKMINIADRSLKSIWDKQEGKCAASGIILYEMPIVRNYATAGGIGIDIINYKRVIRENNIRFVAAPIAVKRHIGMMRRMMFKNDLEKLASKIRF